MPQPAEPERLSELRFTGLRITLQRSSSCKPMGALAHGVSAVSVWLTRWRPYRRVGSGQVATRSPRGPRYGCSSWPGSGTQGRLRRLRMDGGAHVDGAGPAW